MREWLNGSHDEENLADAARNFSNGGSGLLHIIVMFGFSPGNGDIVRDLAALVVDVDRPEGLHGFKPLHLCRQVDQATALLDAGADVNALSLDGKTPLIMQARKDDDRYDIVRLLVRRGADLSLADNNGRDAMMFANGQSRGFLTDVVAAGGWKAYLRAPRIELVRLRSLCARGRARPPSSNAVLQRLFGTPGSSARSTRAAKRTSTPLPNEVFWHVLTYWCTRRDLL
jgi:hypothetical protein